ncbi:uncharacterized protein LOC132798532 isoform X1 [Drosophila nasuta]|uniref:uncharacterized protein LOC132798532 isoform X1 n=1 Tax=Drosophila nasuta TaxID=42062 RepID=UPI00295F3895|nr:uncharacterized protein LOC132798532 isoform X1 [Drosophila nasuta]
MRRVGKEQNRNEEAADNRSSLLHLNDDVLSLIVDYLEVFQQFELSQLHSRLLNVVQALWRTRVRNVELLDEEMLGVSSRQFQAFITALTPHVEQLNCQRLDVRRLRQLSDGSLNRVTQLEWDQGQMQRRGRLRFVDEDVRLLKRLCPGLRQLTLRGCQVTGRYLCELQKLEELCLDECECLKSKHFRDIFRQLKLRKFDIMDNCDEVNCCDLVQLCPTLENIKIADYHLCMETDITQELLQLPHLRELSIYSKNFVFDVLERITRPRVNHGKLIEGVRFNGLLHDYGRFFRELGNLHQLRRLEVKGVLDEGMLQRLNNQMLEQLAPQLPELQQLHISGYQMESDAALLKFVSNCRQLRILDVNGTRCGGDAFVERCLALLAKQSWRSHPLELWILCSDISYDILKSQRYLIDEKLLRIYNNRMLTGQDHLPNVLKFSFVR